MISAKWLYSFSYSLGKSVSWFLLVIPDALHKWPQDHEIVAGTIASTSSTLKAFAASLGNFWSLQPRPKTIIYICIPFTFLVPSCRAVVEPGENKRAVFRSITQQRNISMGTICGNMSWFHVWRSDGRRTTIYGCTRGSHSRRNGSIFIYLLLWDHDKSGGRPNSWYPSCVPIWYPVLFSIIYHYVPRFAQVCAVFRPHHEMSYQGNRIVLTVLPPKLGRFQLF